MDSSLPSLVLVEDNPDDAALFTRALSRCDVRCEIILLRDGAEALEVLLSPISDVPQLIVLDFHLPGMDGLAVLRALRKNEKTRSVPIVMHSQSVSRNEMAQCIEEGANSVVPKSTDPQSYVDHAVLILRYWLTVDNRTGKS